MGPPDPRGRSATPRVEPAPGRILRAQGRARAGQLLPAHDRVGALIGPPLRAPGRRDSAPSLMRRASRAHDRKGKAARASVRGLAAGLPGSRRGTDTMCDATPRDRDRPARGLGRPRRGCGPVVRLSSAPRRARPGPARPGRRGHPALAHGTARGTGTTVARRARGRISARLSALARHPGKALAAGHASPGSASAPKAAEKRATLLINTGRYPTAEDVLEDALPRPAAAAEREVLRRAMNRLLRFEGRTDEVAGSSSPPWREAPDPAGVLKELWLLDTRPSPSSPGWRPPGRRPRGRPGLARQANEAIMTGRFAEAARRLDSCRRRRPDDRGGLAGPTRAGRGDRRGRAAWKR